MRDDIVISEVFGPTIQGEGPLTGVPTVFVRTGGCDFRCSWCDSMHAVDPRHKADWRKMTADDVLDSVINLTRGFPLLVSLSGGNPALMPLGALVEQGQGLGYAFAMETQGTVERDWFSKLDHLVLSPKGPSSGMPFERRRLQQCLDAAGWQTKVALKVVVFSEEDYQFARQLREDFGEVPMYLQAGTPRDCAGKAREWGAQPIDVFRNEIALRTQWLVARVAQDRWFDVRVGCQLHAIIWGDERGV